MEHGGYKGRYSQSAQQSDNLLETYCAILPLPRTYSQASSHMPLQPLPRTCS